MDGMNLAPQRQLAPLAMGAPSCVHIVDDDAAVRTALARLLQSHDCEVECFDSAESFLAAHDADDAGCIVLDVSMPGLGGLGLQRKLLDDGDAMPIIFLTGSADVPLCATAMRNGAVDFLTKPLDGAELMRAVAMALQHDEVRRSAREHRTATETRLSSLTPREREVLDHVMNGRLNKQIAGDLGTAEKTVKVHRARAMEKMRVRSVAELVRMVERARVNLPWLS